MIYKCYFMLKFFITSCGMTFLLATENVIYIDSEQICKPSYISDAILRKDPLFADDFLTLHSLLRMAAPASVFEIGTCTGEGTLIIKNAVGDSTVYSLDLPLGESSYDLQEIGAICHLPYIQIIGNSCCINYSAYYPIEAWFIDGTHDYPHVFYETKQALLSQPRLIVWHDADISEVFDAIKDSLHESTYLLFQVKNTRIAFSIPSDSSLMEHLYD